MARILGLKQLLQKKYAFLEGLPEDILKSFGTLTDNFQMIVWGDSGNGKSNLLMQFLKVLMPHGNVLYVGLEEGFEATMQLNALRHLNEGEHSGKIGFADHEMSIDELTTRLKKKKSARFIVIDSLQYWDISYRDYKKLKEAFKNKTFIFISHAKGKKPEGKVAEDIMYDATIKVRVEGYVAFIKSRLGGNNPYVIWEEGAKLYFGKQYKKVIAGLAPSQKKTEKKHRETKKSHQEEIFEGQ